MLPRIFSILCALITCFIAAYFNYYPKMNGLQKAHYLFEFSVFYIMPMGAIFLGMIAGSGYYLSTYITNKVVNKYDFCIMLALSVFGIYLIYATQYFYQIEHGMIDKNIPFFRFLIDTIENASYQTVVSKKKVIDVGPGGAENYQFAFLYAIGFICASLSYFFFLKNNISCADCVKYLRGRKKKVLYFKDIDTLNAYISSIYKADITELNLKSILFDSHEKYQEKLSLWNRMSKSRSGKTKYIWKLKKCEGCQMEALCGTGKFHNNKDWVIIPEAIINFPLPKENSISKEWNIAA